MPLPRRYRSSLAANFFHKGIRGAGGGAAVGGAVGVWPTIIAVATAVVWSPVHPMMFGVSEAASVASEAIISVPMIAVPSEPAAIARAHSAIPAWLRAAKAGVRCRLRHSDVSAAVASESPVAAATLPVPSVSNLRSPALALRSTRQLNATRPAVRALTAPVPVVVGAILSLLSLCAMRQQLHGWLSPICFSYLRQRPGPGEPGRCQYAKNPNHWPSRLTGLRKRKRAESISSRPKGKRHRPTARPRTRDGRRD